MQPTTCNRRHATDGMQPTTCNTHTRAVKHTTVCTQHAWAGGALQRAGCSARSGARGAAEPFRGGRQPAERPDRGDPVHPHRCRADRERPNPPLGHSSLALGRAPQPFGPRGDGCVTGGWGGTGLEELAGACECAAIRRRGRCSVRISTTCITQRERYSMQHATWTARCGLWAQCAAAIAACNNNSATHEPYCNMSTATCTM